MVSLLAALIVTSTLSTTSFLANASPAGIAKRDNYAPSPILPNANSVWTIGHWESVTWDTTIVPSTATNVPWVDLYQTSSFGSAEYVLTLAQNVDPQTGHADFQVPDVEPGSYFVMAWGQSSPHFTIQAPPFVPKILTPVGTTVWSVGGVGTVTWDTSNLPDHPGSISAVWLYTTSEFGSALFVATLATNVDARAGTVSFSVPDDIEPREYFVMVGAWANSSQRFSIIGPDQ